MASKVQNLISRIQKKCNEGTFLFRGEAQKFKTPVSSSLLRIHYQLSNDAHNQIPTISKIIIENAKRHFDPKFSDFETLAHLQHYGGKTPLIDFSRNMLIALFFACSKEFNKTGYIYILNEDKDNIHEEANDALNSFYSIYESANKSNRFIFQSSVFVYSRFGYIEPDKYDTIKIPASLKLEIISYLDKFHNINENTIYNDIYGFISNEENFETSETLFNKGLEERFYKRYENAISYFTRAIKKNERPIDIYESYAQRSICYLEIKEYKLALDDINTCITSGSYSDYCLIVRAEIYFCGFNNSTNALEDCNNALTHSINNRYLIHEKKAEIYYRLSRRRYSNAKNQTGEEFNREKHILKSQSLEEYSNAIENYNGNVSPSPLPRLYKTRAKIFKEIGETEKATKDFERSKEIVIKNN